MPGVECAHASMEHHTAVVACQGKCDREALLAELAKRGYGAVIR
jgi:hypothetical protein